MKLAHCRSCDAPIIWTVTQNGKKMPVDADPVIAERGFRLEEDDDPHEPPTALFTVAPFDGERLHLSHFATCPDAREHRR